MLAPLDPPVDVGQDVDGLSPESDPFAGDKVRHDKSHCAARLRNNHPRQLAAAN
jgi:hypothetical protein